MIVLLLVAVLAGAGTALSPCVLPVLPALLAATGTGGRRRPIGVVLGLTVTFGVTIVGLGEVVDGVGLGTTWTRDLAIVVLVVAGLLLLLPSVAGRLEAPLSRLARFGPRGRGTGFWSGVLVGAALGFVYAPCAGPILAAVVTVSAASGKTVAVGVAYALGSAGMLLALALGGRKLLDRVNGPTLQRVLGAVLLVTALALVTRVDLRFETLIARHAPDVSLTAGLEDSKAVRSRLDDLRPAHGIAAAAQRQPTDGSGLRDYGAAPDFTGTQRWFNTADDQPLSLKQLRGRVVLVDFWTYTCINCLRTLPYLEAWDKRYRQDGLTIVGVHAPEFGFEHDAGNVRSAIAANGIKYPVVQDNDMATWSAYGNQYWPAEYLIDKRGHVRHVQFGEGDYAASERAIRSLLGESGADAKPEDVVTPSAKVSPETYVGAERADAQQWPGGTPSPSQRRYTSPGAGRLGLSQFALGGTWKVDGEHATAGAGATLDARVQGRRVYLVLSPGASGPGRVQVLVNGRPYRTITVRRQQLYTLVDLPREQRIALSLRMQTGVSAYAFTFG